MGAIFFSGRQSTCGAYVNMNVLLIRCLCCACVVSLDNSRKISLGNTIFTEVPYNIVLTKYNVGTGLRLYSTITISNLTINNNMLLFSFFFFVKQLAPLLYIFHSVSYFSGGFSKNIFS